MILSLYMGDFEMAGPARDIAKAWYCITDSCLQLDELGPVGDILRLGQFQIEVTPEDVNMRVKGIRPAAFGLDAAQTMSTPKDLCIRSIR